jgi:3-phenylpropionate/trans-cinnamate dioxygenase ferredoxin reductase subunit
MAAPIVVVGAGQAGLQTAEALRAGGHQGGIVLIGDEPYAPYHRPPLSKGFLLGETAAAQLTIRSAEALQRKGIELRPGARAVSVDRAARRVELQDGRRQEYAGLCLATGARPRKLALTGADLPNVLALRSLADARAIAQQLEKAQRVVVIGGGFIGLEVAAVARRLGKDVVVLEFAARLMARSVSAQVSDFYAWLHAQHGVRVELQARVERIEQAGGLARAVGTADGRGFDADLVLVGIGIDPEIALAQSCALECAGGIVVDECSRTADPAIVAAGDCTARRLADGTLLRLESVQNAVEQARCAAAALLGQRRAFGAHPWFWSDQYDVKLQIVGLSLGHDHVALRGDPAHRAFSAFYYRQGRLIAVDSINRPAEHLLARRLLDAGASPDPQQVADPGIALEGFLAK